MVAHDAGFKIYDLGGIDPENNPSVYQCKSRLGGREIFHIGAFESCRSPMVRLIWRMCESVHGLVNR
jgi:lipid II:glycine glycyltransferase (peptidoglycan interpeptide bridge formation enzyme)